MGRPPKTPNDELDKFLLRMPDGLRARIKAAADTNNRSMNAEIITTLEREYPVPITLDDVVADVHETIKLLRRFKGKHLLMTLADDLDRLILDIGGSDIGTPEDREAAIDHVATHGKFNRFVAPDDD